MLLPEVLRCPLDKGMLAEMDGEIRCRECGQLFPEVEVRPKHPVLDFRCLDRTNRVALEFSIPHAVLTPEKVETFGRATKAKFRCPSRSVIKKTFGTKLPKECMYYAHEMFRRVSTDGLVLDLGCGSGGSKRYLQAVGFSDVIAVDYMSTGAEYLVDVHRMPFHDASFDVILTTATLEHFCNPFVAFAEMSRVMKPSAALIATGSFWEAWHGHSCFHFTPDGLHVLCQAVGLELEDLWSASGFLPSVAFHAFRSRRLRSVARVLQVVFDWTRRWTRGRTAAVYHRLETSGAFGICARKLRPDRHTPSRP
jgi:SAM-dependent methyltransferase